MLRPAGSTAFPVMCAVMALNDSIVILPSSLRLFLRFGSVPTQLLFDAYELNAASSTTTVCVPVFQRFVLSDRSRTCVVRRLSVCQQTPPAHYFSVHAM